MFCTKLKELKISGECPFAKTNQLEHSEQLSKDVAHLSTSKDVQRNAGENAPHQKSSRAKVNLHTLGESIRKLACPEVRKNTHHRRNYAKFVLSVIALGKYLSVLTFNSTLSHSLNGCTLPSDE